VRDEAGEIVNDCYNTIRRKQDEVFDKMQKDLQMAINKVIKDVDYSADICRRTSKHAKETGDRLFKIKSWWDLIWYSAPIAVLLNLIFRVYQHFSELGG